MNITIAGSHGIEAIGNKPPKYLQGYISIVSIICNSTIELKHYQLMLKEKKQVMKK